VDPDPGRIADLDPPYFGTLDPDPQLSKKLDPEPHQSQNSREI
jgi:hypothetical protein